MDLNKLEFFLSSVSDLIDNLDKFKFVCSTFYNEESISLCVDKLYLDSEDYYKVWFKGILSDYLLENNLNLMKLDEFCLTIFSKHIELLRDYYEKVRCEISCLKKTINIKRKYERL